MKLQNSYVEQIKGIGTLVTDPDAANGITINWSPSQSDLPFELLIFNGFSVNLLSNGIGQEEFIVLNCYEFENVLLSIGSYLRKLQEKRTFDDISLKDILSLCVLSKFIQPVKLTKYENF